MIINVTEQQKMVIESQGYMVIQFKAWAKKFLEWFSTWSRVILDIWDMIFNFLEQMASRIAVGLQEIGKLFKPEEIDWNIETRPKYVLVRNIGQKYVVRYKNPVIYYLCRNNC